MKQTPVKLVVTLGLWLLTAAFSETVEACTMVSGPPIKVPRDFVVTLEQDGIRLPGFRIEVKASDRVIFAGKTRDDGTGNVRGLPAGTYWLVAGVGSAFQSYTEIEVVTESTQKVKRHLRMGWIESNVLRVPFFSGVLLEGDLAEDQALGRAIAGAKLTLREARSNKILRTAATSSEGSFDFTGLSPGYYSVEFALVEDLPDYAEGGKLALQITEPVAQTQRIELGVTFTSCGLFHKSRPISAGSNKS
jgi:hypothetical protein